MVGIEFPWKAAFRHFNWALGLTIAVLSFHSAFADDAAADKEQRERRLETIRGHAAKHNIAPADDPNVPLELRDQPLLNWTNPTRGDAFGGVFLWTKGKRPMAIGCVNFWVSANELGREFHSLSEEPLTAKFANGPRWTPPAGIQFQTVPGSKMPADSPVARLREMKRIVEEFSIKIDAPREKSEVLRALTRPVYRYEDADAGIRDGAIYVFVQGTDPEAFLLIEARTNGTTEVWKMAVARCTTWSVKARYKDKVVYDVPLYKFGRYDPTWKFVNPKRIRIQ